MKPVTKLEEKHLNVTYQSTIFKDNLRYRINSLDLNDFVYVSERRGEWKLSKHFKNKDVVNNHNLFETG